MRALRHIKEHWIIIGSGHGLLTSWYQYITWTNDNLLLMGPLGTNFSETWFKIADIL